MELALTDLFRARWTDTIHKEWIRSVLAVNPKIPKDKLLKTRDLMNSHVRDALVTGYESLIPSLSLPDADDRHVLAAAIRCGADVIVTMNLKDFPAESLKPWDIDAQHPDEFISNLIDLYPDPVMLAVEKCRSRLQNPPVGVDEYLEMLINRELPQAVARLKDFYF
jgi:hypothetical protein